MLYKQVVLDENEPVQYLGVYATQWQQEWGEPTVGFCESEYQVSDALSDLGSIRLPGSVRTRIESILLKLAG